jgi:glucose/mannose transport system substrate-binding protein
MAHGWTFCMTGGTSVQLMRKALATPASRRGVLKGGAALGLGSLAMGPLGSRLAAAQDGGKLEVFSWWTSPGESKALQALFDAYNAKYPDVEIVNSAVAGGAGVKAQAVLQTRLQGNQPPDSWQTHIGRELVDRYEAPGYCEPITDLYDSEGWVDVMPAGLVELAAWESEQYAVPVNVHRGNTLWYNKKILADNGVEVGDTMSTDEFLAALDTLKTAGVTPLAFANSEAFEGSQMFEDTLLAVGGPDTYNAFFKGEKKWDEDPDARQAAEIFAKLLDYINDDFTALTWDDAIHMVIEGRAAFNSMGDWAYGEVVAKNAQDNIGWVSHPGTAGSFILVVDSFTLPKGAPDAENAANWLKILGSKEAQEAFNPLKGSIAARTDVNRDIFSPYHQWSMDGFAKDTLVPSLAHGMASSPAFQVAHRDASTAFVTDKDVDNYLAMMAEAAAMDAEETS